MAKRFRISYSSAKSFEACPKRFEAEKILRVRGSGRGDDSIGRPIYLLTGVFLHEVLDRYTKHLISTKQSSDFDAMITIFDAAWKDAHLRAGIPEDLYEEMLDVIMRTRESVVFQSIRNVVGSEVSIGLTEDFKPCSVDDKNLFVLMKLDRLEADDNWNLHVFDYKTGYFIDDVENSMQLKVYGLGVKMKFPKAQDLTVELFYARKQLSKARMLNEQDYEDARRWLLGVSDRIEAARKSGKWRATPGRACMDCPIFDKCPARAIIGDVIPPTNLQEAENLLAQYILLERQRGDVQEKLKAWVSLNGALVVNGMMAEYGVSHRFDWPMDKLKELLAYYKLDWEKFVKPDGDELKKVAKDNEDLAEGMAAIVVDKSYSKFALTKVKG